LHYYISLISCRFPFTLRIHFDDFFIALSFMTSLIFSLPVFFCCFRLFSMPRLHCHTPLPRHAMPLPGCFRHRWRRTPLAAACCFFTLADRHRRCARRAHHARRRRHADVYDAAAVSDQLMPPLPAAALIYRFIIFLLRLTRHFAFATPPPPLDLPLFRRDDADGAATSAPPCRHDFRRHAVLCASALPFLDISIFAIIGHY
jgi:hypothetical protein